MEGRFETKFLNKSLKKSDVNIKEDGNSDKNKNKNNKNQEEGESKT